MTKREIIKVIKDRCSWHYKAYQGDLKDGYKYGSRDEHYLVFQVLNRILKEIGE